MEMGNRHAGYAAVSVTSDELAHLVGDMTLPQLRPRRPAVRVHPCSVCCTLFSAMAAVFLVSGQPCGPRCPWPPSPWLDFEGGGTAGGRHGAAAPWQPCGVGGWVCGVAAPCLSFPRLSKTGTAVGVGRHNQRGWPWQPPSTPWPCPPHAGHGPRATYLTCVWALWCVMMDPRGGTAHEVANRRAWPVWWVTSTRTCEWR